MRTIVSLFFWFICSFGWTQTASFEFKMVQSDSVPNYQVEVLKLYIGKIALFEQGTLVHQSNEYFLLDLIGGNSTATVSTKKNVSYDSVAFEIGVDSTHNVAGILEGALDPGKGMYWSWQSGYINFKVEAVNAADESFVYHLGGYLPPFACNQAIGFSTEADQVEIALLIDDFLNEVSQTQAPRVMSPGQATLDISKTLKAYFRLAQ